MPSGPPPTSGGLSRRDWRHCQRERARPHRRQRVAVCAGPPAPCGEGVGGRFSVYALGQRTRTTSLALQARRAVYAGCSRCLLPSTQRCVAGASQAPSLARRRAVSPDSHDPPRHPAAAPLLPPRAGPTLTDLTFDESLDDVGRCVAYSCSSIALQRLVHAKLLADAARGAGCVTATWGLHGSGAEPGGELRVLRRPQGPSLHLPPRPPPPLVLRARRRYERTVGQLLPLLDPLSDDDEYMVRSR